jgi:DNA polymerase-3 subunit alpha
MVKIVSRQRIGTETVYDIGVVKDHNFLLANGLVASNCFNKSHSTAYAYVTYQTAYLKANYPAEYMAALLTANSGDQDKVNKYIANCNSMGIDVEPPNINQSEADFTPVEGKILFGLSAIKNVGAGAVRSILETRNEGGAFKSIPDLCDRVDLHKVKSSTLESLIKCGAFDSLNRNRQQAIDHLKISIDWAQKRAKEKEIGQLNIFELAGLGGDSNDNDSEPGFSSAPEPPNVADLSNQEKLQFEKELLGFYVSDHPLKSIEKSSRLLGPIHLNDLANYTSEKKTISAIVMLSAVKEVITRKGDRMAIVQMEDLTGSAEGVIFPKSYERIDTYIQPDHRLIIWGKVDQRDEKVQIIIEDAEPIEQVQMVMVELSPYQAGDIQEQHRLKDILLGHKGEADNAKIPVVGIVNCATRRIFVPFGQQFRVENSHNVVNALQLAGYEARSEAIAAG